MGSWERPLDGLTSEQWRRLYARLDWERAHQLYFTDKEPGASYRRVMDIAVGVTAATPDKGEN